MRNLRNASASFRRAGSRPSAFAHSGLVPPQASKADYAHLVADLFEGWQQLLLDLLPSPPVVADVKDIILLGRSGRRRYDEGWIEAEEGQRCHARIDGWGEGRLDDVLSERIIEPHVLRALMLAQVVPVVSIHHDHRIIPGVCIQQPPACARYAGEHRHLQQAADAV
jgi:hypothetical protein